MRILTTSQLVRSRFAISCALGLVALTLAAPTWADGTNIASDVYVSSSVTPYVLDVDLRNVPRAAEWQPGDPIKVVDEGAYADYAVEPDPDWQDPIRQRGATEPAFSTPLGVNFGGIGFGGGTPPDVVGAVGPEHYIQMVNASRFQIWDKTGAVLVGETDLSDLWTGSATSPCADGDGDPIVQYDQLADRWMMSEFDLSGNTFCYYISQTPDPVSGGWFVYDFSSPRFPDYPQYGVWPDAYYVGTFESPTLGIYAFDRTSMLAGAPATFQRFTIPALNGTAPRVTRILPADVDGPAPPDGSPNYFARTVDDTQDSSDPTDRIEIWEFIVDFGTPANSSFTQVSTLIPSPFTLLPCSPGIRDCVPQPGTANQIDALFNRPLRRLQYRNFGSYETMLFNQVVDAGGVGGKRWFELRKSGAGPWSIYQEGTYSPDSVYRFMGSVAMNGAGHIALGYSVSDGDSVIPGIRATARRNGEALGLMTMEELVIEAGTGIQTNSQRWGDYSSMNIDPVDDRTFWYTNQMVDANGFWTTHVGSFTIDGLFFKGFESGTTDEWSTTVQ
ncbi:MAG: hypothetical protein AAF560_10685 [Acidobacteriota bacterium]